jgi:hypothetical protein
VNLLVLVVMVGVVVAGATTTHNQSVELRRVAVETHAALCAFKLGLQDRVASAEEFLIENPEGIPGISRQDIQRSIDAQKSTLLSLDELDCS